MHLVALLADDPSLSHALRSYRHPGVDLHLHPVGVRDPRAALTALEPLDFAGALVLDEGAQRVAVAAAVRRSLDAEAAGAADTVTVAPGGLIADYNLGRAVGECLLSAGWDPRGATVAVLGAGGAAGAVARELSSRGAGTLMALAGTRPEAESVLDGLAATTRTTATTLADPHAASLLAGADLLVRLPRGGAVPADLIGPHLTVVDLDPAPVSALRRHALNAGALSFNLQDVLARRIALALGHILGGHVAVEGLLELLHRDAS